MTDPMGDRLKGYEAFESDRKVLPQLPICIRIDGKAFSQFTKGMNRPYDERMSRAMIETTKHLVKLADNALIGYTQSDEISLLLYTDDPLSQIYFDGKIMKLTSVLASAATIYFYKQVLKLLPDYASKSPMFDARVFVVPNKEEAANVFLWRCQDAERNSVSMAASDNYSHKELQGKTTKERLVMLEQKGIIWGDYPSFFKRGTFVRRRTVERVLTKEEREAIPEPHRPNEFMKVKRTDLAELDMPPFSKVKNRVEVLFDDVEPVVEAE